MVNRPGCGPTDRTAGDGDDAYSRLAAALFDLAPQLAILDQHEHRALSRRHLAIREFDLI
jgi:hypothetical protein